MVYRVVGPDEHTNKRRKPMLNREIETHFENPPIPTNAFDWVAVFSDYDEGDVVGHGATEQEAIDDLIINEAE